jgi:DNA modification methylase
MYVREVTVEEYLDFVSRNTSIAIDGQSIPLKPIKVNRLDPSPRELPDVSTTVWSFPKRGSWATHKGDYRGNWPPQIPRALILKYTSEGDVVLDPMVGSGTTCIEAVLLGRNCIGVDLNYHAVMLTHHRLYYLVKALESRGREPGRAWYKIYHGDARRLDKIRDDTVDLVLTHPPYLNIVRYGEERSEGDLSAVRGLEEFIVLFKEIAREVYRVLKPGKTLAVLVGDTRIKKHYVPLTHYVLLTLLDTGFVMMEEVVKIQHKMKTTREVWSRLRNRDFLLIYHEKLFILRKPVDREPKVKYSGRQDFVELKL